MVSRDLKTYSFSKNSIFSILLVHELNLQNYVFKIFKRTDIKKKVCVKKYLKNNTNKSLKNEITNLQV